MQLTSVSIEQFATDFDPLSVFEKIYKKGEPAFFFESESEDGNASPVTIIGLNPAESISIVGGELKIEGERGAKTLKGPPLENLKKHLAEYMQHKTAVPLPFSGGAVGFMGYDCVQYLEKIPLPKSSAQETDLHLFIFSNYIIFDRELKRLKVISLSLTGDLEHVQAESRRIVNDVMTISSSGSSSGRAPQKSRAPSAVIELQHAEKLRAAFQGKIKKIKEHIRAGDIFQCVLSQPFELEVKSEPIRIFEALKSQSAAPYYFYLDTGRKVILGASPEMLVRVRGSKIQTCPIAGTRKLGKTEKENQAIAKTLFASVKEKAEHAMLVDLSRNDIGRISKVKTVRVSKFMELRKFSHVMHLVSLVEGELKEDKTAWDALFSCFPAGTLSGAPKIRAMQIISDLEEKRRGFYGGAIVAADFAGNLDSCIAIRSLSYENGKVRIQAGAGVVADSQADREFEEILDKTKTVRAALAQAEGV